MAVDSLDLAAACLTKFGAGSLSRTRCWSDRCESFIGFAGVIGTWAPTRAFPAEVARLISRPTWGGMEMPVNAKAMQGRELRHFGGKWSRPVRNDSALVQPARGCSIDLGCGRRVAAADRGDNRPFVRVLSGIYPNKMLSLWHASGREQAHISGGGRAPPPPTQEGRSQPSPAPPPPEFAGFPGPSESAGPPDWRGRPTPSPTLRRGGANP